MINWIVKILMISLFWIVTGCEKPMENPETIDPIYNDIVTYKGLAEKDEAEILKTIEDLEKEVEKQETRDPVRKKNLRDLATHRQRLLKAKQNKQYFELLSQSRKEYSRRSYYRAYSNKEKWPDPKEFEEYKVTRRLRAASRNWSDRVPKPTPVATQPPKDAGKEKKSAH